MLTNTLLLTSLTLFSTMMSGLHPALRGEVMGRRTVVCFFACMLLIGSSLYAQRSLFSETIPLQGHIDLQEKFTLEVKERVMFVLNQDVAGTTHEIATYEFFSNSPEIAYQLRLSPGYVTQLGEGVFAFRNVSPTGGDSGAPPIPFRLTVKSVFEEGGITNETFREIRKGIGIREGSKSQERGTIFVTFPTANEGFNLQTFTFGAYEASISIEVSAD